MRARAGDPDELDFGDEAEDPADLGQAIAAEPEEGASAPAAPPAEAGPRRRLLVLLGSGTAVLFLWMLFRSVPEESDPAGAVPGRTAEATPAAVEEMANQGDPSWMQAADSARRLPAAPAGVVPPVFGAPGGTAPASPGPVADGPAATASDSAPPGGGSAAAATEDPRRSAYAAALKSRPLQGGLGAPAAGEEAGGREGVMAPLTMSEQEAAAEAEAARRSAGSPDGVTRNASDAASPVGLPGAARSSGAGSSYTTGGSGAAPTAMASRLQAHGPETGRDAVAAVLPVGTVIQGHLYTAVESDLPGTVVGVVTQPVYDPRTGAVAIPRHSWRYGTYESDVATGQNRLVVHWTALRLPTGETFDLPGLPASDRAGASGLPARVDRHYRAVFGNALLSSVFAAAATLPGSRRPEEERSRRDVLAEAAAQQVTQTAAEVTRRNLAIKPTLRVPRFTRFSILLDRTLTIEVPRGR